MLVVKGIILIGILLNVCAVTIATDVSIRLAGSTTPEMGRLEVRINGTWGTVHSSGWSQSDADVVCNQLGYSVPVVNTPLVGYFGQGTSMPVYMAHVDCVGNERSIFDCQYTRPVDENHDNDVGVICKPRETSDYHVRLVNDNSENSGRVEIFIRGTWGSICDKHWILNDATVVCRNLGFAAADAYHQTGDFGESSDIHLNDVTCLGTESGLRYCRHEVFNATTATTCSDGRDVGVTCLPKKDLQVRLVGSNSPNEGRIEVLLEDVWSPILNGNTKWELSEGDVVCRSLGFETAYDAVTDGRFGDGQSQQYSMMDVKCMGNEASLEGCVYEIISRQISNGESAVGVVCGSKNGNDGDVRLVGGKSANEGRLEIYHYGKWGSICKDGWKADATQVACKQMGYPSANSTIEPIPGPDGQPIHLDDVICYGSEENLSTCQHEDWGIHDCSHSQDVAIVCNRDKDYDVRLVGGQVPSEGRVEIFANDVWGAICDKNWTLNDTNVVCRSLGFPSGGSLCGTSYISTPVPKLFHKTMIKCLGSEANIQNCSAAMFVQQHQCDTSACIRCAMTYEDKQILLMGGKTVNEGVPEVYNVVTGQWDLICDDNITHGDKNVICRSMGFASAKSSSDSHTSFLTNVTFSTSEYGCFVKDLTCNGTEIDVRDCAIVSEMMVPTNYTTAPYIYCNEFTENSIRLVGGTSPREGRVEVYHGGQWGTVCISSWSATSDAAVVCRSLGLGPPPLNSGILSNNPGIGPIHLTDVACAGSENTIADCDHSDWGINTCSHEFDVMVKCSAQLPYWCGNAFCKEGEICKLRASSEFYCQSTSEIDPARETYLVFILPILVFFVILACYITMRLCHSLPVQPHKDCLNLIRRCCGKKPSNYRIILTSSDEIILVENAS